MVTLAKGTWWRRHRDAGATQVLRASAIASTRTIFVGNNSSSPLIVTVDTTDLAELAPTYTARTANGSDQLYGVAHIATENETVAVGNNGRVEDSQDQGLNWSSQVLSLSPPLYDVVGVSGDASRFVAAGFNSIWTQNQSAVWTRTWQGGQRWDSVTHMPGVGWVAVGQNGYASHSPTALNGTWLAPYQITTTGLAKVRSSGSLYMAVGQGGKIFTSATGLSGSWADRSIAVAANLNALAWLGGDSWIAIWGTYNRAWYTDDNGINWTELDTAFQYGMSGVDSGATYALACGGRANTFVSYDQIQADYVEPADIEPPGEVGPAFSANDDMAGDAIRRLITQFRSGRG